MCFRQDLHQLAGPSAGPALLYQPGAMGQPLVRKENSREQNSYRRSALTFLLLISSLGDQSGICLTVSADRKVHMHSGIKDNLLRTSLFFLLFNLASDRASVKTHEKTPSNYIEFLRYQVGTEQHLNGNEEKSQESPRMHPVVVCSDLTNCLFLGHPCAFQESVAGAEAGDNSREEKHSSSESHTAPSVHIPHPGSGCSELGTGFLLLGRGLSVLSHSGTILDI
ncbi:hypothetical protein EK904_009084 [Melospiza melodia maxima]|nr:hypothetical protein EK904_009084 [Melospiza melodia maxima]